MSRSRLPRLTALAVTTFIATAATAAPAHAGSWEEVTRASGAQGAAPLLTSSTALAVSDNGRYAVFQHVRFGLPAVVKTYVRDTLTDTTRELAPGNLTGFYGIDRAGQNALVLRNDASGTQSLILVPLAGGTPKVVLTTDKFVSAALSGDGKTIAYSEGLVATSEPADATYTLAIASGTKKKLDNVAVKFGKNSISDDGTVVAGTLALDGRGVYYRGTAKTITPASTVVSPNGAIVATFTYASATRQIIARRLSDGYTTTLPVPEDAVNVAWIAPDGLQLAFGSNRDQNPIVPARVLNLATGAVAAVTGPFAKSLDGSYLLGPDAETTGSGTAISRSGRYGLTRMNERAGLPLAVVDVQSGDLPGTEAPASASAYVATQPPVAFCGDTPEYFASVNYSAPQAWVGQAKRLEIVIRADGTQLVSQAYDNPKPDDGVRVPVPAGTQLVTYSVKVIDPAGRTQTSTDSAAPVRFCPFP